MKKLFFVLLAFALPQISWGQLVTFNATLLGAFEVPARLTPASGFATLTFDTSSLAISVDYSFANLLGPQTGAHIHLAPAGVNGPIIVPFPLGNNVHFDGFLSATQATALFNESLYLNIHSTVFPGGEIRGQFVAVPEPSTYAMAGAALLGLAVIVRKRRKIAVAETVPQPGAQ